MEFDAEFKFAKIQNCHVEGGGGGGGGDGGGGAFLEFDAEFKFAKIQNCLVEGGGGVGGWWNLMLSSNLLKSKITMLRVGGGGLM